MTLDTVVGPACVAYILIMACLSVGLLGFRGWRALDCKPDKRPTP